MAGGHWDTDHCHVAVCKLLAKMLISNNTAILNCFVPPAARHTRGEVKVSPVLPTRKLYPNQLILRAG